MTQILKYFSVVCCVRLFRDECCSLWTWYVKRGVLDLFTDAETYELLNS